MAISKKEIKDSLLVGRRKQITIIGDADASPEACIFAEQIGAAVAQEGYILLTGGKGGIMEAANKGAHKAGGISVGILPSTSLADANQYCNLVIPTGLGHARNAITSLSCDAIVSIGGGAGTLSEICYGWIYKKPIFVFDQFGGWSEKTADQQLDKKYFSKIERCTTIDELCNKLQKINFE